MGTDTAGAERHIPRSKGNCPDFSGSWVLEEFRNADAFFEATGAPLSLRKLLSALNYGSASGWDTDVHGLDLHVKDNYRWSVEHISMIESDGWVSNKRIRITKDTHLCGEVV